MKTVVAITGCLLAGITAQLPAQEMKIATVNVARVLEEFTPWQKDIRVAKEKFAADQRERANWESRYKEMISRWEELRKQADDKTLSKDERRKADKAMTALTTEIKELERMITRRSGREWGTPEQMFNIQLARRRKLMLDEVQKAVTTVVSREQCVLVFDISRRADDGNGGGLLWVNPARIPDLSSLVLAELNRLDGVKQLYAAVNGAEFFSIGGVGEAGQPSAAETAFRKLLEAPDAVEQCRSLLADGKPVGRLYGFLGLKLLNARGDALDEAQIHRDKNTVRLMRGRKKSEYFVAEIAKQIAQGKLK